MGVGTTRDRRGVSLSARRAWIEISFATGLSTKSIVALRKESVDRNSKSPLKRGGYAVALRKESVDRNRAGLLLGVQGIQVALRKESVDRNRRALKCCLHLGGRSPQGERG